MLRREISYTDLTTAAGLSTEETLFVSRLRANEDAAYNELVREYHSTLLLFGMMLDNMEAYGEVPVIAPAQTRIEMTASTYTRVLRPPVDLTQPMFVEAHVGEDGKVPHYFVLLGPENDPAVDTWLDDLLFAAVFAPATLDGQPIHSKLIMFLPGISIGVNES
jgi:hypothetical protein